MLELARYPQPAAVDKEYATDKEGPEEREGCCHTFDVIHDYRAPSPNLISADSAMLQGGQ